MLSTLVTFILAGWSMFAVAIPPAPACRQNVGGATYNLTYAGTQSGIAISALGVIDINPDFTFHMKANLNLPEGHKFWFEIDGLAWRWVEDYNWDVGRGCQIAFDGIDFFPSFLCIVTPDGRFLTCAIEQSGGQWVRQ